MNEKIKSLVEFLETKGINEEEIQPYLSRIEKDMKNKKYGLVWEEQQEEVYENLKNNFPILNEMKEKEIKSNKEDSTNLLIEGDNIEALTVFQYTHKEKIDVIYIDPPYNRGKNDFVYNDNFIDKENIWRHSSWLSFMNKRLKLAKELMTDEGIIFISIDDNELAQLKLLCDEIFGENNFISILKWKKGGGKNDSKFIKNKYEYILVYLKNKSKFIEIYNGFTKIKSDISNYKFKDSKGLYQKRSFCMQGLSYSKSLDYPIEAPDGTFIYAGHSEELYIERQKGNFKNKDWCWTLSKDEFISRLNDDRIIFSKGKHNSWKVYYKSYYDGKETAIDDSIDDIQNNKSSKEIKELFGENAFNYAKPIDLIKKLISLHPKKEMFVLDFFAGSGTTGQAVLELNKEDDGKRKFILCTNNEVGEKEEKEYFKKMDLLIDIDYKKFKNTKKYKEITLTNQYKELGICRNITYKRISKVINGYKSSTNKFIEGMPTNLRYYTINSLEKEISNELNKINILNNIDNIIEIKENCYDLEFDENNYKIISNKYKNVIIYLKNRLEKQSINDAIDKISNSNKELVLYVPIEKISNINTWLDDKNKNKNIRFEKMPKEIIDVYKKINKI